MNRIYQDKIFRIIVNVLNCFGEGRNNTTEMLKAFRIFTSVSMVIVLIYIVGNFRYIAEEIYVENMMALILVFHV